MANLIAANSKLIEQQKSQLSQTQIMQSSRREQADDGIRQPKTIRIIKDQSGFGFNVRGQISGKSCDGSIRQWFGRGSLRCPHNDNPLQTRFVTTHITIPSLCSWRPAEIDKRRAVCAFAARLGDPRERLRGAGGHQKGRPDPRSVSIVEKMFSETEKRLK